MLLTTIYLTQKSIKKEKYMGRFRRFMDGRYGNDQFGRFLSLVTIILLVISIFSRTSIIFYIALVSIIYQYSRIFSRNCSKRYAENARYLRMKNNVLSFFKNTQRRAQDKTHCYFKCPNCKKSLRVPKGRGKIRIHCPACKTEFVRKT